MLMYMLHAMHDAIPHMYHQAAVHAAVCDSADLHDWKRTPAAMSSTTIHCTRLQFAVSPLLRGLTTVFFWHGFRLGCSLFGCAPGHVTP